MNLMENSSDSDIECVFVSESSNVLSKNKTAVIVQEQEIFAVSDEGSDDCVEVVEKIYSSPIHPAVNVGFSHISTPTKDPPNGGSGPREDWELLFESGNKAADLSDLDESMLSVVNPAEVGAFLLEDELDVTITSQDDVSFARGSDTGRRSASSDVVWIDEAPIPDESLVDAPQIRSEPDPIPAESSGNTACHARKRRSNCLATPRQAPSCSKTERCRLVAGEVAGSAAKPPSKRSRKTAQEMADGLERLGLDCFSDKDEKTRQREAKKLEKERLAERKAVEKGERQKQRKAVKLQKESEKLQKQALKEAYRPLQGGKKSLDCLRARIPQAIVDAMGRAELLEGIAEDGSKIHFDEIEATGEAANVIRWTRSHVTASIECSAQANVLSTAKEEIEDKHLLIQISKKNFVSMIDVRRQLEEDLSERDSLISFHRRLATAHPGKSLHFFVYGMDSYFRNQLQNAVYGDARPARSKPTRRSILDIPYDITHMDMDEALMDFACRTNHRVNLVESTKDFARLFVTIHKAIAEATFKHMKKQETQLFDAISANTKTNGVFVPDDSSDGYKELWIRQLEQFSLVSRDVAVTIVAQYPSPRLLMKAYDACATEAEREQLVENVIVRRGTERRVGPKMSKMLYAFMCSGNGDEILE